MRKVPQDAFGVRAVVSALKSREVASAISGALEEEVAFKSSDIACYSSGSYFRSHSDTFGERRIALVFLC